MKKTVLLFAALLATSIGQSFAGDMQTGTIKWFNMARGYGYIQPDNGEQEVYVHISSVISNPYLLDAGKKTTYAIKMPPAGKPVAIDVSIIE